MYKVYAVGVMKLDLSKENTLSDHQRRLWYFFANFEDAEKCVLENHNDIFEYYYNVALIEEHYVHNPQDKPPIGFDWLIAKQWWYQAQFLLDSDGFVLPPVITLIDQPEIFKHTVNFWAG